MIIDEQTYLEHHGVKGMRWGVRKEKRVARKAAKEKKYGKRGVRLTGNQQQARINRLSRRVTVASTTVYAATRGYEFLQSERGLELLKKSGKTYRRTFHPTVEDKIKDYIRKGPPPKDFIDVRRVDALIPIARRRFP